jgi:hypothetical protein
MRATVGAKDASTSSFTQSAAPSVMKRPALRTPSASSAWWLHERHVGHDEGARGAALDGCGEGDQEVERRMQRGRVAEDDLCRRVAHEEHRDARALEPAGGRRVVAGEGREGNALAHRALQRTDRHGRDGRIRPGPGLRGRRSLARGA